MPEKLITMIGSLPFMLLLADEKGHKYIQVNKTRILEAVLISCITGIVAGAAAGKLSLTKLETKIDIIEKKVDLLDSRLWAYSQENHK